MTTITLDNRAVFVNGKCVEDDARTRDDAYTLAVNIEASLVAARQPAEIVFAAQRAA